MAPAKNLEPKINKALKIMVNNIDARVALNENFERSFQIQNSFQKFSDIDLER